MNRLFPMKTAEQRAETVGTIVGMVLWAVLLTVTYAIAVQI